MSSPTLIPPSPTPSPAKSRWARVGGVTRRASSVLVAARPTTPSGDKEDTASLKGSLRRGSFSGINTSSASLAPPSTSHGVSALGPIAESPAQELAATEDAPHIGPSPLSLVQTAEPLAEPPAPAAEPSVSLASPRDYIPPPLIDSTAVGPGGFTDEPDELPQSEPIQDPYRDQSRTQTPEPIVAQEAQPVQPSTSHEVSAPSPIAESPAQELAATEDAPHIGPSPLSLVQTAEPLAEPPAPAAEPSVSLASPRDYIPPPLIDSTAVGPGGFTDEPDELPQSEPIQDPYRDQSRTQTPEPPVAQEAQLQPAGRENDGGRFEEATHGGAERSQTEQEPEHFSSYKLANILHSNWAFKARVGATPQSSFNFSYSTISLQHDDDNMMEWQRRQEDIYQRQRDQFRQEQERFELV